MLKHRGRSLLPIFTLSRIHTHTDTHSSTRGQLLLQSGDVAISREIQEHCLSLEPLEVQSPPSSAANRPSLT